MTTPGKKKSSGKQVQYDVNDLFNVTEDDVTCSICLEIVTKPRRLPCQHSFCESCLGEWYRCNADFVANKYLHCPLCRERHAMPKQSGVRQFSLDHRMEAMADYVRNIPQMPTENVSANRDAPSSSSTYQHTVACHICCQNNASSSTSSPSAAARLANFYCITCLQSLCGDCYIRHLTLPGLHQCVTMETSKPVSSPLAPVSNQNVMQSRKRVASNQGNASGAKVSRRRL